MPTAPSFADFTKVSETFTKNGKLYIKVKNEKTGTVREVRWYSDSEYAKAYGEKVSKTPGDGIDAPWEFYRTKEGHQGLKKAWGFDHGPILVVRRNRPEDEEWLRQSVARYAVGIGWYIVSTDTFPIDAPKHFKYLLLGWDEFRDGDDYHAKKPSELDKILSKKMTNREWFNIND